MKKSLCIEKFEQIFSYQFCFFFLVQKNRFCFCINLFFSSNEINNYNDIFFILCEIHQITLFFFLKRVPYIASVQTPDKNK